MRKFEKGGIRKILTIIAIVLLSVFIAVINGPLNFILVIKIISLYVGTILIGILVGMLVMWLLYLITGIEVSVRGAKTFVDGVWKGDDEDLKVAKIRYRIEIFSIMTGLAIAGISIYFGLFGGA